MTLSGIDNHEIVSKTCEIKIYLLIFYIIGEIQLDRSSDCTCHLIHQSGRLVPEMIFRILTDLCIVRAGHFSIVKEIVHH